MVLYFVIADFALRLLRLCRIIKADLRKKELCYVVLPTVQIVCWFILHHNEKLIRPINNEWESLRVMFFFPVWDYISLFSPHFISFFSSQNSDSDLFSLRKNPWSICPLFCKHLLFPIFKKMQKKTLKDVTVFSGSDRLRSHSLYLYNSFQLNTYINLQATLTPMSKQNDFRNHARFHLRNDCMYGCPNICRVNTRTVFCFKYKKK